MKPRTSTVRVYWLTKLGLKRNESNVDLAAKVAEFLGKEYTKRRGHRHFLATAYRKEVSDEENTPIKVVKQTRALKAKPIKIPQRSELEITVDGVDVKSKEFLLTRSWRELRYKLLSTGGNRCQCCGKSPPHTTIHVDHIKPRHTHPELALDINNLQVLCEDCNIGKGAWDSTDWKQKIDIDTELSELIKEQKVDSRLSESRTITKKQPTFRTRIRTTRVNRWL